MKQFLFIVATVACFTTLAAQTKVKKLPVINSPKKIRCHTDEIIKRQMLENFNTESEQHFENWLAAKTAERKSFNGSSKGTIVNYTLPIIFHIIHPGDAVGNGVNLSASTIHAQLSQLNKDYANLTGSPYAVASKTGIQFGLANSDPSNNTLAEPGIDRINLTTRGWTDPATITSPTTLENYMNGTIKPTTIWDPTKYVNVWLVDMSNSGLLGYATFPTSSTLQGLTATDPESNTTAGVVIEATSAGSKITATDCGSGINSYNMGRTLTHEMGHFMGLRHISGDQSTCSAANDYCNDTPKQLDQNYGKPTHPKPNNCGTLDEMYENFMDYCDDQVLNTFTVNQVDRMQTVMLNSPRRITLPTSGIAKTFPTGNSIQFDNCTGYTIVSESATAGTTNRYTDINILITVDVAADAAATLNFSTTAITGTNAPTLAVDGVDYTIITPSLNFSVGDVQKFLTVRVIDNAKVDGQRGVNISYTITGTGVTAAVASQTMNLVINDDDNIIVGQNTINLLSENFSAGSMPTGWNSLKSSAYTSQWVVGSSGDAGGAAPNAYVSNNVSTKPNTYSTLPSGQSFVAALLESPLIEANRVSTLGNLSFKYKVKGRTINTTTGLGHYGNLFFSSDDDVNGSYQNYGTASGNAGYGPYANTNSVVTGSPSLSSSFLNRSRFYIDFYWSVSSSSAASNPGFNIDDVVLTATPWNVETTVSNSYTFNTQSATTHNFRNATNGKAIVALTAQSADANDVIAAITESGTDRPTFSTTSSSYLRSRKTFKLTSSSTTNSTTHTITLYYTQAEVSAWGSAALLAKIMKVSDGVSIATGNLNPNNAVIAPTTVTDKLTSDGYIAYTATFTGFGQYVIVEQAATLPLQWGLLTGTLNNATIHLNWNTFSETNTKGFDVERGLNSNGFKPISFVKATNKAENIYSFNDAELVTGNRYNYRIKQIDNNGKTSYSNVISIAYNGRNNGINVYPNPVNTKLVVQIAGNNVAAEIKVSDVLGKNIYCTKTTDGYIDINTSNWVKGNYFVTVTTKTNSQTFNIVKD